MELVGVKRVSDLLDSSRTILRDSSVPKDVRKEGLSCRRCRCPVPIWHSKFACSVEICLPIGPVRKHTGNDVGHPIQFLLFVSVSTSKTSCFEPHTSKRTRYGLCHIGKRTELCVQYPDWFAPGAASTPFQDSNGTPCIPEQVETASV